MVFVGNGGAKERKDAIPGGLGDVAFIAMHGFHHQLQGRINEQASFLRIEVFDQFHGAFDVGKEGSDDLALAV